MELMDEAERYEAGVIPHDLVLSLGELALSEPDQLTDEDK